MPNYDDKMPQYPEPYWRDSVDLPRFPKLTENLTVDVAIVGGGITGITAAYLLAKEGKKVAILEAGRILNGTTGHTTAKITAQHDLIYYELIQHMGEEKAKLYYQANIDGLEFVRQTVQNLRIDCDFSDQDAYLFTHLDSMVSKMQDEAQAYHRLGIDGDYVDHLPFDLTIQAGVVMRKQAQFHPLKYLHRLVQEFQEAGGLLYESTAAVGINHAKTNQPTVMTREGYLVQAKDVVIASHFPFFDDIGFYFTRMRADRSYVIAIQPEKEFPDGMYLGVDPDGMSLRSISVNGEKWVLVAGYSHKTGQGGCTMSYYQQIEEYARKHLGIRAYGWRWSAQDLQTLDKVPYIGQLTDEHLHVYVATGYRKWGMSTSSQAGLLLRDLILGRENPYAELYNPSRFYVDPSIKYFLKENVNVAGQFLKGKLGWSTGHLHDLQRDEATVVMLDGERCGAYRDTDGNLHIVDTTCTHMGCEVEWNHGDRTWDCPCHGSRYSIDGDVIEGPALLPLTNMEDAVKKIE